MPILPFLNNPKDLDLSCKMDLDLLDCFGRKKTASYNRRNTVPSFSRHHLEIHCRSHTGAREFSCEICGKQLVSRASVKRHHETIHQDNTPFECLECGKKYKTKDGLHKHAQTHGDRKFKCDVSNKLSCLEAYQVMIKDNSC